MVHKIKQNLLQPVIFIVFAITPQYTLILTHNHDTIIYGIVDNIVYDIPILHFNV